MENIVSRIESSWGILLTDKEGNVVGHEDLYIEEGEENYLLNIEKIDVVEYLNFMKSKGWKDIEYGDEDILSVGFWKKDGSYEHASSKWREEIIKNCDINERE